MKEAQNKPVEAKNDKKAIVTKNNKKSVSRASNFANGDINNKSLQIDVEKLLTMAVQKDLDMTKLERLITLSESLKAQWAKEQYFQALSEFQSACPVIMKESKVDYNAKSGRKVKYNYATLGDIVAKVKDLLKEYGFSYDFKIKQTEDSVSVTCFTHHSAGHTEFTEVLIPIAEDDFMNGGQKIGTAITYGRRNSFCNGFGIMTADPDTDNNNNNDNTESDKMKKEILFKATQAKKKMTPNELKHFYDVRDSDKEYQKHQYDEDIKIIQEINERQ